MNNLEQLNKLMSDLESVHETVYQLKSEIATAISDAQSKPTAEPKYYEFTEAQLNFIEKQLGKWLREKLDGFRYISEQRSMGSFEVSLEFDLGDAVREEWGYDSENDFICAFDQDCVQEQEQNETTEQGEEQHQDC